MLTVKAQLPSRKGERLWLVECDCGQVCEKTTHLLSYSKSCGCIKGAQRKIQSGNQFGYLTAIEPGSNRAGEWICRCFCGNTTNVRSYRLLRNKTRSCGCMAAELRNDTYYENHPLSITDTKLAELQAKYFPELTIAAIRQKLK